MAYTNPFAYGSTRATARTVVDDTDSMWTVVTETDEYLGKSITWGNVTERYDVMITLDAAGAIRMATTLAECDRAVMIVKGRVGSRRDLPTVIPAGYVFPYASGAEWNKATS